MTTTTRTTTQASAGSEITAIAFVALLGATLVFMTGFARASVLHDSSHDVRHSISFPCH